MTFSFPSGGDDLFEEKRLESFAGLERNAIEGLFRASTIVYCNCYSQLQVQP